MKSSRSEKKCRRKGCNLRSSFSSKRSFHLTPTHYFKSNLFQGYKLSTPKESLNGSKTTPKNQRKNNLSNSN